MLYIRRLFHQDMTHQITANRDGSLLFFKYDYTQTPPDRTIYFTYKDRGQYPSLNNKIIRGILHPDESESRINGDFKGFLVSNLQACEGDILLMWNNDKDITKYTLSIVKQNDANYNAYKALLGKSNHIVSIDEDGEDDNNEEQFDDDDFDIDDGYEDDSKIDTPYRQYITAIKSKPFLILAGISGTGKSRIVRELARACWDKDSVEYKAQKPSNFEMIQVKPNWHDSSELIGYVSRIEGVHYIVGPFLKFMAKAIQDPDTPYFLCLDEMNLAPVEQYFAEYLSVIESRKSDGSGNIYTDPIIDYSETEEYENLIYQLFIDDDLRRQYLTRDGGKRLTIPQNLIVVGTVNMDETTFSFSRKVLDRAMTIEMNDVDLEGGLKYRYEQINKLSKDDLIATAAEGIDVYSEYQDVCDEAIKYLKSINNQLEGTPFKIAYRTRNEVLLYVVNNLPYNIDVYGSEIDKDYIIARALDEITSMKILTRIEGDESKVSASFIDKLSNTIENLLNTIFNGPFGVEETEDTYKSISLAKLAEMKKRLATGYTSFWS